MKSFIVKLRKSLRETNYNRQNENNNLRSFIFETMRPVFSLHVKVWVKGHTLFLTVITQITTISLNLGTSNKNLKTIKFSLERSFQKE